MANTTANDLDGGTDANDTDEIDPDDAENDPTFVTIANTDMG